MNKISFSKPKYIRKYDFMRYFYRPKSHWFWPTSDIDDFINKKIKEICFKNSQVDVSFDIEDIDDEYDSNEDSSNDSYDIYKEKLDDKNFVKAKDLDENDPKIIEGQIIDQKAKEFIKKSFNNLNCVDFDSPEYKNKTSEQLADITLKHIINKQNIILFQPTFIAKQIAIAKPDAFIILNGEYILIETKATTKTKANHFLDIFYQDNVINFVLKQNKLSEIKKYITCIAAIIKNKKNEISFILNENIGYQKNGPSVGKKLEKEFGLLLNKFDNLYLAKKQDFSICNDYDAELSYYNYKNFIKFYKDDKSAIKDTLKKEYFPNHNSNSLNSLINLIDVVDNINFWEIVKELSNHEICELDLLPTDRYTSNFKDNDSFKLIKEYYRISNLFPYVGYTGNIRGFKKQIEDKQYFKTNQKANFIDDIVTVYNHLDKKVAALTNYINAIRNSKKHDYYFLSDNAIADFKNHKKTKKVYFDFETISLAIRIIDDTPPFLQVVNQVSIITDNNLTKVSNLKSNNIVIDPTNITIKDFKYIIDQILLEVTNPDDYNFVVYNKSFEKTRLDEMGLLINEKEYFIKINNIIRNLWDLADYFNIREKDSCIYVWELKGYYSIKYVLNMIMNKNPDLFKKTGCKNYKELNIQNGLQAQSKATLRFFGIINNDEWELDAQSLKEYCENDVRAMIAVEYWIDFIISQKEKNNA